MLALSGCSGSSGSAPNAQSTASLAANPAGSATATTSGGASPQASPALSGILGSGGPLDVSKLCAAVPQADVQKLFKATAPAVTAYPGECTWGGGGITVDIFFNDTNKQYYGGGGISPATATHIAGVGDLAQWQQPVPGQSVPFLAAHKGSTTVTVSPSLNVDQTTMAYTGSSPFFKVSNAAAKQYAAEEGQICNDIFAAAGS